jgi:hypothetical protein
MFLSPIDTIRKINTKLQYSRSQKVMIKQIVYGEKKPSNLVTSRMHLLEDIKGTVSRDFLFSPLYVYS